MTRHLIPQEILKPPSSILKIRAHEILIGFSQINDALDEPDDPTNTAQSKHELNYSLGGVTHDELVHTKPTDEDRANSRRDLFVRSHRFPIHEGTVVNGL